MFVSNFAMPSGRTECGSSSKMSPISRLDWRLVVLEIRKVVFLLKIPYFHDNSDWNSIIYFSSAVECGTLSEFKNGHLLESVVEDENSCLFFLPLIQLYSQI